MKVLLLFRNILVISLFLSVFVFAQEPIGGPYTADSTTLVLLHFDDNLNNESGAAADGEGHSNNVNGITYLPNPFGAGMGSMLRLQNGALTDSSFVSIADSDTLDLTGDWTIEGWVNVYTYGDPAGWNWLPGFCVKPGDAEFSRPNWWVGFAADNRMCQTGFHTADSLNWPAVNSLNNIMIPGRWVHITFMRDSTRKLLIQMIHDVNLNLISFDSFSYATLPVQEPLTNSNAVLIGWAGPGSENTWLSGFVDEIRISNVLRNFAVPPIISSVTQIPDLKDDVTQYEVSADIIAFLQTGGISAAEVRYTIDKGATWSAVPMFPVDQRYTGVIPQLPFGSTVEYYVWAKDSSNSEARFPQEQIGNLHFSIFKDYMMVLHLDFEEGTGTPIDKSVFKGEVSSPRPFNYSTDAKVGTYSFFMQSDPDNKDSSYLIVKSPFLTSLNFNIDLWVKFDLLKQYVSIINRPIALNYWWQNNYTIRTQDVPKLNAQYFVDPAAPNRTGDYFELITDTTIQAGEWYHLIFSRDSLRAKFELRNANDELIEEVINDSTVYDNPPLLADHDLRIGNGGNVDGTRGLEGRVDDIKIYNNFEGVNITGTDDEAVRPVEFSLEQNFPNPFNPTTRIRFAIPRAENVTLAVYDIMGRKIKTLVNDDLYVGTHETSWDGTNETGVNVSSGIYFYRLFTESISLSRKMILLK